MEEKMMYNDDSFQQLREDVFRAELERNEKFLGDWCKEARVETPVGYYKDYSGKRYIVYTDRPGQLIGKSGELVKKYTSILHDDCNAMDRIEFVEIRGGFANYAT